MVEPVVGAALAGITLLEMVAEEAAMRTGRDGATTRPAGASSAGRASAMARVESGRAAESGLPAADTGFTAAGVPLRCDAGTSGAGLGGAGAAAGGGSFCTC